MTLAPAPITIFQEKIIPGGTRLAGWAALIHALALPGPVRRPSWVSEQHVSGSHREEGAWTVFDKRYWPGDTLADHLAFALRREALDLLLLKRVFEAVPRTEVEAIVRAARTGTACATISWAPAGFVPSSGALGLSRNSWPLTSPPRHERPSGAPAPIWWRARPASCCWPTARQALRSRVSVRRATGWSDGAALSSKPAKTGSRSRRWFACSESWSRTPDSC